MSFACRSARRLAFALVRVAAVRDASFGSASSWEVPGPETRVFARHPACAARQCSTFGAYYSSGLTPARRDSGRRAALRRRLVFRSPRRPRLRPRPRARPNEFEVSPMLRHPPTTQSQTKAQSLATTPAPNQTSDLTSLKAPTPDMKHTKHQAMKSTRSTQALPKNWNHKFQNHAAHML